MKLEKLKEGDLITITRPTDIGCGISFSWSTKYDYSYVGKCFEFLECVNGMVHLKKKGESVVIRLYQHKYEDKIEFYKIPKY